MTYRHIVLFRMRHVATENDIEGAQQALRALGGFAEVASWKVERSLDARKGVMLVEDATFADAQDFELWRARAAHGATAALLSEISDWWVGDYET